VHCDLVNHAGDGSFANLGRSRELQQAEAIVPLLPATRLASQRGLA
jgi:hypothetical protein